MAKKTTSTTINLSIESGAFSGIFNRLRGQKKDYDFSGIADLRQLLSNERARVLHTIKNRAPESIYSLAKMLGRDFKSVRQDVKLLERFGFIELESAIKGKREMLKPIVVVDNVIISIAL